YRAQEAIDGILSNFPVKSLATFLRFVIFPLGMSFRPPLDSRNRESAQILLVPGEARDRLTDGVYIPRGEADPTGALEAAFLAAIACEPVDEKLRKAVKKGKIVAQPGVDLGSLGLQNSIITAEENALWQRKEALRRNVIKVNDFAQDFGRAEILQKLGREQQPAARAAA
ncbi:MAG: DUF1974 domain-containing protein, partial [Burkholderiales bacterium]|nr:DUF1974 domain-containing protein [Burkholderiales bacterium]